MVTDLLNESKRSRFLNEQALLLLEVAADFQQATLRQSIAALVMLWLTPLQNM